MGRAAVSRRFTAADADPARTAAATATGRPRSVSLRFRVWPVLALLVLLAGAGATLDAASDPMVEDIQRALVERGFDPGKVDGAMGRRTRNALRAFQRSVGLPESGEIDHATVTNLGLEAPGAGAIPAPADAPPSEVPDDEPDSIPTDPPDSATGGAETTATPDADTPSTEVPRAKTEPAADTPRSGPSGGKVQDAPADGTSVTESPEPEPTPAPEPDPTPTTTPEPKPATTQEPTPTPKPEPKPLLSFATLGWHGPQTGAAALERFTAIGAPPDFERGTGSLFVPKSELVFVLQAGERISGLDCDPGAGRISVEFVFGPDGPVIFTPAAGAEYCRMGIGIALEVGRTLEMRPLDWRDARYPQGTVRVTREGLQYID